MIKPALIGLMVPLAMLTPALAAAKPHAAPATAQRFKSPVVAAGVASLAGGDYAGASTAFAEALRYDARNAYLHFLNGATYHLAARQGDESRQDLAEVGYTQALRFDPNAWWAAYALGLLQMERREYRAAQDAFAQALLVQPENAEALQALAAASYQVGDLALADIAATRALQTSPGDRTLLRSAALIAAAVGQPERAQEYAVRYEALETADHRRQFVRTRLDDWAGFHRTASTTAVQYSQPYQPPAAAQASATAPTRGGQVVVDVVYVRMQGSAETSQGVNLLRGLQLQYAYTDISHPNTDTATPPLVGAITQSLGIPAITYSLNIFNSQQAHNEILARPTLVAQEGRPSTFFSGNDVSVALPGQYGGILNNIEVGLSMEVMPLEVTDTDTVLQVKVKRTAFDTDVSGTFKEALQTSHNSVSATVTLGYDQTLILTGLTDRETSTRSDRTPLLGSIPGVQYLFKQKETAEHYRSVLIMLTPRRPGGADPSRLAMNAADPPPHVAELQKSWGADWRAPFHPGPNLPVVLNRLKDVGMFRQLRAGDVMAEDWERPAGLESAIQQDLRFLYF